MTKQENQICHAKLPDQINKTCIKQSPHWFPVIDAWRRCITLWIYELAHHSSCKCFLQQVLSPNAFQDFLFKSKIKLTFANLKLFCKETEVSSKVCCIKFICFFYLVTQDDVLFFFFAFTVFKMATGIGIAALPRTMMSQSQRSPSASLWPSLTMILCPCPPTQMQLMRSCPSKRGRSLGWEFTIKIRNWCTAFLNILSSSVHLFCL